MRHHPAVAGDVGGKDGGEMALHADPRNTTRRPIMGPTRIGKGARPRNRDLPLARRHNIEPLFRYGRQHRTFPRPLWAGARGGVWRRQAPGYQRRGRPGPSPLG